jgi:hypothetical protein
MRSVSADVPLRTVSFGVLLQLLLVPGEWAKLTN